MSKNAYGRLERGEIDITINHLQQVIEIFNIDLVDLLKEQKGLNLLVGDYNHNNFNHNYYDNQKEVEKLKSILQCKDELIAQQNEHIAFLKKLLEK